MFTLYLPNGTKYASFQNWLDAYNAARYHIGVNAYYAAFHQLEDYYIVEKKNVPRGTQLKLDFAAV